MPEVAKLLQYVEPMSKAEHQPDKGVQQSYKDVAHSSANVMFRTKIKGETNLDHDIPLHMTLKTFDKPDQLPLDEIKSKAEELDIQRPDPSKLQYEPITFKSPRNGNTYYMLKIHGTHPSIEQFNQHFKGQGITHDSFMAHVTINKDLYDRIKSEGIKPHEVEFSPLMIEHGAGNVTHLFQDNESAKGKDHTFMPEHADAHEKLAASEADMDDLQKASIKHLAAGLAAAGTFAMSQPVNHSEPAIDHTPVSHTITATNPTAPKYDRKEMLRTIASVESQNGKFTDHETTKSGQTAYGKYGLMPNTIHETIKMNPDLRSKYGKASRLSGNDLSNFMRDNPGLEDTIAEKHVARLEHHFGQDPSTIGYAWLNGVTGTYKAKKSKVDIGQHWHVQKINKEYGNGHRSVARN